MKAYIAPFIRGVARRRSHGFICRLATKIDYDLFEASINGSFASTEFSSCTCEIYAELERNGICVVADYWTAQECAKARLEVDRIICNYPGHVHPSAKSDFRVYGADRDSQVIKAFNRDKDLASLATAYNHEPSVAAFTLAARMPYSNGNTGSGEGWHRDAFLRQFKAIIYLSDVGTQNGPFQMIRESHRTTQIMHDMKVASLGYMQNRLKEQQVAKLIDENPDRLLTFTGSAGTLILVDTSTIHRGMPINDGIRYALTNYYYPEVRVDKAMYEKFKVLPSA